MNETRSLDDNQCVICMHWYSITKDEWARKQMREVEKNGSIDILSSHFVESECPWYETKFQGSESLSDSMWQFCLVFTPVGWESYRWCSVPSCWYSPDDIVRFDSKEQRKGSPMQKVPCREISKTKGTCGQTRTKLWCGNEEYPHKQGVGIGAAIVGSEAVPGVNLDAIR